MQLALVMDLLAQSAPVAEKPPPWYQAASGVLGVPVAALGVYGSWQLVKKCGLERRKLILEIQEKEDALNAARRNDDPLKAAHIIAKPILEGRRVQDIVLRFVLLYLVLQVWNVAGLLFGTALTGAQVGLRQAFSGESSPAQVGWSLALAALAAVPSIGHWFLFVALGWPLLLDIVEMLRLSVPSFVRSEYMGRALLVVALVAAIGQNVFAVGFSGFS